jgi:hypothetical protein
MQRQSSLTHDAAEDCHRVDAYLHDGEVIARLPLHRQHLVGPRIALVRQLPQLQSATEKKALAAINTAIGRKLVLKNNSAMTKRSV